MNENGEFRSGAIGEGRESYRPDTYGRIFAINRQSIVNDNLGAFSDIGRLFASASAQFEAQFLVDPLTSNNGSGPVISDSKKLFDAAHSNLAASGATISDTTLAAARLALRSQKVLTARRLSASPASSWWRRRRSEVRPRSTRPAFTRLRPRT